MVGKSLRQLMLRYRYDSPPPTLKIVYAGQDVAELKKEQGKYIFRYLEAFSKLNLTPLPGLKIGETYESQKLPLYFEERLPDTRRPEVQSLVQEFKIPEDDSLLLLATLGRHTVTDPFEFRLESAA